MSLRCPRVCRRVQVFSDGGAGCWGAWSSGRPGGESGSPAGPGDGGGRGAGGAERPGLFGAATRGCEGAGGRRGAGGVWRARRLGRGTAEPERVHVDPESSLGQRGQRRGAWNAELPKGRGARAPLSGARPGTPPLLLRRRRGAPHSPLPGLLRLGRASPHPSPPTRLGGRRAGRRPRGGRPGPGAWQSALRARCRREAQGAGGSARRRARAAGRVQLRTLSLRNL